MFLHSANLRIVMSFVTSLRHLLAAKTKYPSFGQGLLLLPVLIACGQAENMIGVKTHKPQVEIAVMIQDDSQGFKLNETDYFSITLANCASGYQLRESVDGGKMLRAYRYDRNCIVKLETIYLDKTEYLPSQENPFTDYSVGDSAIFTATNNPNDTLEVIVQKQINSVINNYEFVSYKFRQNKKGDDAVIDTLSTSAPATVTLAGEKAIPLTIKQAVISGFSGSQTPMFVFRAECAVPVKGVIPVLTCDGHRLDKISFQLVSDTYGGTLSYSQNLSIFAKGFFVPQFSQLIPSMAKSDCQNGGVDLTTSGLSFETISRNMLLVVRSVNSFLYFNVDLKQLSLN